MSPRRAAANGHSVLLLHGNNFGGFYFKALIDGLTSAGFRVIVPDQIGYGRSSKPIAPYNFNSQARNTFLILQKEKIERVMVVGHSMGGMLAARLATQYPKTVERLVIYNPIGLTDGRFDRPMTPIDEAYEQTLKSDYQSIRASLGRYVAHNPKAWNAEFEGYTRIRYSWTLSADWPRLAMVQALVGQMLYADPVVYDWAHIQVPTLAFGGAEDMLLGPAARFQERMQYSRQDHPQRQRPRAAASRSRPRPAPRGPRQGDAAARRVPQAGAGVEVARGQRSFQLFSVMRARLLVAALLLLSQTKSGMLILATQWRA